MNVISANIGNCLRHGDRHYLRLQVGPEAKDATWYEPFIAGWLLCSDSKAAELESLYQKELNGPKH